MAGEHNERVYYFVIDRAHRGVSVAQLQNIGARNPKVWGSIPHRDSDFFSFVLRSWQDEKTSFFVYEPVGEIRPSRFEPLGRT